MRIGLFPGQAEALRAAYTEQRRRLTRRGLFLAAGSSILAGACGFAAGHSAADAAPAAGQAANALHALALGPIDELRRQSMHIDSALESAPADPVLGLAFQRLLTLALTQPEDEALARRLLRVAERPGMPAHLVEGARLLQRARRR